MGDYVQRTLTTAGLVKIATFTVAFIPVADVSRLIDLVNSRDMPVCFLKPLIVYFLTKSVFLLTMHVLTVKCTECGLSLISVFALKKMHDGVS